MLGEGVWVRAALWSILSLAFLSRSTNNTSHLADFPAVFLHISNSDICHEIQSASPSSPGQPTPHNLILLLHMSPIIIHLFCHQVPLQANNPPLSLSSKSLSCLA